MSSLSARARRQNTINMNLRAAVASTLLRPSGAFGAHSPNRFRVNDKIDAGSGWERSGKHDFPVQRKETVSLVLGLYFPSWLVESIGANLFLD
jgi:hypothetical protein